jgi:RNA polymerase sigma-70 factor, ECF subfamily
MTRSVSADFDAFYTTAVRRVVLYLFAVSGDRSDAQDIAQEAFARAWQHWPEVSRYDDPDGRRRCAVRTARVLNCREPM